MRTMQTVFLLLFMLPVLAGQYFSLEQSAGSLLSAILSLLLLVFFLGPALSRLRPGWMRTAIGLLLISLPACYFYGQFLSYYLQGSYFNQQFYFHLNLATLTETWSVYWPLAVLFLAWLAALWMSFLLFRNRLETLRPSTTLLTAALLAALALDPGLRQSALASWHSDASMVFRSLEEVDWDRLKLDRQALQNSSVSASPGNNLVLVFMEGLGAIYTDQQLFPGLTPNLNRFAEQGWQLDNIHQVSGSEWTMGGIVSTLCGTPLLHDLGLDGNLVMFTGFLDRATCLPDILAKAGYQQAFLGGASLDFAGKGEFFTAHSYDHVLGRRALATRQEDPERLGGWGLYDDALFDLAVAEYERLAAAGAPFNLTVLTVDTHHPNGEPSPGCTSYEAVDNTILHAVHCTDQLVGDFVSRLKNHPAWEDTVVVLVSDHLGMRNNAYSLFPEDYQRRLYFTALNAGRQSTSGVIATPMDLAPTILELASVRHTAAFLAGSSLLDAENLVPEDAALIATRDRAIRYINSYFLSSRQGGERVYSLADSRLAELQVSSHVTALQRSGDGLSFTSAGDDPFIVLPAVTIDDPQRARLYVTIEAEQASVFTVYYSTSENPAFSETNTLSQVINRGENQLVFSLDQLAGNGRLRIDPGSTRGRILIRQLEIRS